MQIVIIITVIVIFESVILFENWASVLSLVDLMGWEIFLKRKEKMLQQKQRDVQLRNNFIVIILCDHNIEAFGFLRLLTLRTVLLTLSPYFLQRCWIILWLIILRNKFPPSFYNYYNCYYYWKVCQCQGLTCPCHKHRLPILIVLHHPWCHSLVQGTQPLDHYHLG